MKKILYKILIFILSMATITGFATYFENKAEYNRSKAACERLREYNRALFKEYEKSEADYNKLVADYNDLLEKYKKIK